MASSFWRDKSRRVIAEARAEGERLGLSGRALVRHVDAAYPFGLREMHPYKIWCSERRRQLKDLLPPLKSAQVDPKFWLNLTDPEAQSCT